MKKISLLPNIFIFIAFLYSLTHLSQINQITTYAYRDVFNLFTSLFMWMILFSLANNYHFFILFGKIIHPLIYPFLKLSPLETAIYISTIFSGYPTNIKIIKESHIPEERKIHLIKFSSHPSISFVVYILGSQVFNNIVIGYYLFFIQVVSNFIIGVIIRKETLANNDEQYIQLPLIQLLKKEFINTFIIFIYIFGFMLVSRIIIDILPLKHILFTGLLEFSTGCLSLINYPSKLSFIYASIFLSFSSLSVIFQSTSIFEKDGLLIVLIKYRLFQALICLILSSIISFFI